MFTIPELLKASRGKLLNHSEDAVVRGISIDSRNIQKGEAFIAIKGDRLDGHDFINEAVKNGAKCIITEKEEKIDGVAVIKVKNTTKALGDFARYNRIRFKNIPVIVVTGSNGKTTAKEMIAWVLSSKFKVLKNEGTKNNHIGLPLVLLKLDNSYDVAVLEVGTNHFGEVEYLSKIAQANIGVITNIGPSHLEYFKNLKGVFREKYSLSRNLSKPDILVLNADDKFLGKETRKAKKKPFILSVGINKKSDFQASCIDQSGKRIGFKVNQRFEFALNTLGYYNVYNCLFSIAIARILGVDYADLSRCLSEFCLPKSRLNFIEVRGIGFIDDTYNANPASMQQALEVLENLSACGRKIVVMGDMLELGAASRKSHIQAINNALKACDVLVTVGSITGSCLDKGLRDRKNIFSCQTSSEARQVLFEKVCVASSDIVLVKGSRAMKMEEVFKV